MKSFTTYWPLISSLWYFINGLLHDTAVIRQHKGGYDRELLRLLMDGHVLLLSGAIVFISYLMMQDQISYASILNIIVGIFMLIYCALIFPFLKSLFTIMVSLILVIISLL